MALATAFIESVIKRGAGSEHVVLFAFMVVFLAKLFTRHYDQSRLPISFLFSFVETTIIFTCSFRLEHR
jgi:hypothetical protein